MYRISVTCYSRQITGSPAAILLYVIPQLHFHNFISPPVFNYIRHEASSVQVLDKLHTWPPAARIRFGSYLLENACKFNAYLMIYASLAVSCHALSSRYRTGRYCVVEPSLAAWQTTAASPVRNLF